MPDAIVVGSGPNGLAAAIALARAGKSVRVLEAAPTLGGGARSGELTLPGYVHDVGSSVYPMAVASPFLKSLPLEKFGLEWVHPDLPLAHPLDGGRAAVLARSVEETADGLGPDAGAYRRLMGPLVPRAEELFRDLLGPPGLPRSPLLAARFGLRALRSGRGLAEAYFRTEEAQALIGGLAAHSVLPMESRPGAAIALMLGLAGHAAGWPFVRGGAANLTAALVGYLKSLGGEVETGHRVKSLAELPPARAVLLDLAPRQVSAVCGDKLPAGYRRRLSKFRYGPGVFKLDWALSGPIPWVNSACRRAGTVHVGGNLGEMSESESACNTGRTVEKPFVLLAQPSVFDPTRAPAGKHTAWAYCHVPNGSNIDRTDAIESQVERFAPGFRATILGRSAMNPAAVEAWNANCVGGDVAGGANTLWQIFARPAPRLKPYVTPLAGVYLCSASTPPGGGVHGLCGFHAAGAALARMG